MSGELTGETERLLVGELQPSPERMKLQLHLDKLQLVEWVHGLAPWQVISHLTFPWEASLEGARRGYERFMTKSLPHLSYFFAEEQNPGRPGYHVHALWADCKTLYRREAWAAWHERFRMGNQGARARIEPVKDRGDVASYCAKYVTKERAWWNVKLQWHRLQNRQGAPFSLESDPAGQRDTRLPVPQLAFGFEREVFNLASDPPPGATPDAAATLSPPPDPRQRLLWVETSPGLWSQSKSCGEMESPRH